MKKILSGLLLGISFCCITVNAQYGGATSPGGALWNRENARRILIEQERSRIRYDNFNIVAEINRRNGRVSVSTSSRDLEKKVIKYIKPDDNLKDKYRSFLKLPNTGINVLLPEKTCVNLEGESFEKMLKRCPSNFLAGGGSYFSFRNRDYMRSIWADIGIKDDWIFSLGMFNQGILVNLGDAPIEKLTLTDKGISYLNNFVPATNTEEADKQYKQFENGLTADGFQYQQVLPAELDKTYALRVVAYKVAYPVIVTDSDAEHKTYPFMNYYRKDVVVVFRIVKKDADGTLSIIWRELANNNAPELLIPESVETKKK